MSSQAPSAQKYVLCCAGCGKKLSPATDRCPDCSDALLRTNYATKVFSPTDRRDVFRYLDWLPPEGSLETTVGPVVYRSEALATRLDLSRLYVGFNGYAPEIGARNPTGSFKDFEALPTLLRFREQGKEAIILASAGNTARAFAYAATILGFTACLVVPEAMLHKLWLPRKTSDAVRLVVLERSADYAEAIRLASLLSERFGIPAEGGARNVARRDGMGTVVLEHVRVTGHLPNHYVQAVGSGTGAIAAWEASMRLIASGAYAAALPKLHLVQNAPFTPIHDAWTTGRPIRPDEDVSGQLDRIRAIDADVLANRNPPFTVAGGVRDALRATDGCTYAVTNAEIASAQELFADAEKLPISPEAGAAVAALRQAALAGRIRRDESVLLNVTGNNDALLRRDYELHPVTPWLRIPPGEVSRRGIGRWADRFERQGTQPGWQD